jgi:hypothetical protein
MIYASYTSVAHPARSPPPSNVGAARWGRGMRFGFVVPHADAREFADLAALGE